MEAAIALAARIPAARLGGAVEIAKLHDGCGNLIQGTPLMRW